MKVIVTLYVLSWDMIARKDSSATVTHDHLQNVYTVIVHGQF